MKRLSSKEVYRKGNFVSMVRQNTDGEIDLLCLVWLDRTRLYFVSNTSDIEPSGNNRLNRLRDTSSGPQHVQITVPQLTVVIFVLFIIFCDQ